jgi:ubiquinone/menaquinone biosynthesis C-methylase UbiE
MMTRCALTSSGGWAEEVAFRLPDIEVIGVDAARAMVRYATMRAQMQQRTNVRFSVMDITRPLSFPDACFTYIQARFLVGFIRPEQWLPLVQECRRVLVPGGTLCLIESEWPLVLFCAFDRGEGTWHRKQASK